jgi:hypothetical protein
LDDWLVHDRWFNGSCQHKGYIAGERLGNIAAIVHVRELLRSLPDEPTPRFPIMLAKVVYNGVHTGDHLPSDLSAELLQELEPANRFRSTWDACDREFFASVRRLGEGSMATRNRIVF